MTSRTKIDFLQRQRCLYAHHEAVTDPLFRDSAFFDPHDLLLVKCEMLRRVRLDGQSVVHASQQFACARASFYATWRRWQQQGLPGLIPAAPGPIQPFKLTADVVALLQRWHGSAQTPAASLAQRLWVERGIRLHPRTIEKVLSQR